MDKERDARRNDGRGSASADTSRPQFDAVVRSAPQEFGMPGNDSWGKPLDATAAEAEAQREASWFVLGKCAHS